MNLFREGQFGLVSCLSLFSAGTVAASQPAQKTEVRRPNFIFILSDDNGWTDMAFPMDRRVADSQSDYHQTPNLERMAHNGMRFSCGYTSAAVSSPSRRSIQFGETPIRQGSMEFEESHRRDKNSQLTIPTVLKSIDPDYRTAHYGKWDIRADITPEDLGYDESDGNTGNSHGNLSRTYEGKYLPYELVEDPKRMFHLTERGLNFIKRQVAADRPFYLQISHYALHEGYQSTSETYTKYNKMKRGAKHADPGYAAMLDDLDDAVGRILDAVERYGIADNTYIIFMADNGAQESIPQVLPPIEKMSHPDIFKRQLRNYPLRGGKWVLYEGGIRVPFIMVGPGVKKDSQCDTPIVGWDLLPTIADLAGYEKPMPENVDGRSFSGLLSTGQGVIERPYGGSLFFHRYHAVYGHSAVIRGNYKLVIRDSGEMELYDLVADLGERTNIAAQHPDLCRSMKADLKAYMESVNAEALKGFQGKPALKYTEK